MADKDSLSKTSKGKGGFTMPNDPDRMRMYEEMQVGHCRKKIMEKREAAEKEAALPLADRIRRSMVANEQFSVDLVKTAGLDAEAEYVRYNKALRAKRALATRQFYMWFVWIWLSGCMLYYFFGAFFV
eukprot:CAMPEP_0174856080 /NCGR_PEP_ID=MMETSP1114-20130205/35021_1 /TAXON_ID=312471 /ORGANISM="Neobodo designis, Strain CCAP 1951/1" /LENGTH=127 /DNA_ID=CAMNT_0016090857 /DNA_START=92 /DNA_END=475 /DNA_ORIENTATION=+